MDEYETLNHTRWDCKYHVVFIPKYRRKLLFQELRKPLGEVFRQLAAQKEAKVEEGHLLPDHVHMLLSIPPKYAVSNVVGYIKGKSAIHLARTYSERKRNFVGPKLLGARLFREHGWTRRKGDPGVHPEPREGGPTAGATQPLEVTATFRWPCSRSRVSVSLRRSLERPQSEQSRQRRHSRFERLKP